MDDLGRYVNAPATPVDEDGSLLVDADGTPLPNDLAHARLRRHGGRVRLQAAHRRRLVPLLRRPRAQAGRLLRHGPQPRQRRQGADGLLLPRPQGLLRHVLRHEGQVLNGRRRRRGARRRGHRRVVAVRVLDGRDARARGATRGALRTTAVACATFAARGARRRRDHVRRARAARADARRLRAVVAAAIALAAARARRAARGSSRRCAGRCRSPGGASCRSRSPRASTASCSGSASRPSSSRFAVWALAGISVALGDPQLGLLIGLGVRCRPRAAGDRARAVRRRERCTPRWPSGRGSCAACARSTRSRSPAPPPRSPHARPGRGQRHRRPASATSASTAASSPCTGPAAPASSAARPASRRCPATTRRSAAAGVACIDGRKRRRAGRGGDPGAWRGRVAVSTNWVAWRAAGALYVASLDPTQASPPRPVHHRQRRQAAPGRQPARLRARRADRGVRPGERRARRCCAARRARSCAARRCSATGSTYVRATYKRQQVLIGAARPAQASRATARSTARRRPPAATPATSRAASPPRVTSTSRCGSARRGRPRHADHDGDRATPRSTSPASANCAAEPSAAILRIDLWSGHGRAPGGRRPAERLGGT